MIWGYAFFLGTDRNVANRLRVSVRKEFRKKLKELAPINDFIAETEITDGKTGELSLSFWLIINHNQEQDEWMGLETLDNIQKFIEEQRLRPTRWDEGR